ncbi:hypothetical protein PVAP13_5KG380149 [Panicum virgatum]|uniref:Uncharacterized protein n=1 Tax=Panicum virgatum TaxID=38727 RepID=A0A8T0SIM4_PANVG|nr:hypothetical protein PVAP13_5KG380149 [Panicum virgatum]
MRRPLTLGPTRQPQRASNNQQQRAGPVTSRILAIPIQIAAAATQRRRGTQPSEAVQIPNLRPLLHPKMAVAWTVLAVLLVAAQAASAVPVVAQTFLWEPKNYGWVTC